MAKTKIYVIGDKESGVLFLMTDPLRAAIVPWAEIEKYAKDHGLTAPVAFGKVAKASQHMIIRSDFENEPIEDPNVYAAFGTLIKRGSTVSDAEFCFISEVDPDKVKTLRDNFIPLEPVLTTLLSLEGGVLGLGSLKGAGG